MEQLHFLKDVRKSVTCKLYEQMSGDNTGTASCPGSFPLTGMREEEPGITGGFKLLNSGT